MKSLLPTALFVLAAMPVAAQDATAPDLLQRALSAPASKQLFAYDFEDVGEGGGKDEQQKSTIRGRVDPSRKKGDRVTITFAEQTGDKPADLKKIDERYERNADGDIFCDGLSDSKVTNVVDKGAGPGGRIFAFTPRAKADADGQMKDIMKKMSAEAVVDEVTATVRSFEATLMKKHSVLLIAEIKSATIKATCAVAPNGRAYTSQVEFVISGSGLGQSFSSKAVQRISNIAPVG